MLGLSWLISVAPVAVIIVGPPVRSTIAVPSFAWELGEADTVAASAVPENSGTPATVTAAAAATIVAARRQVVGIIRLPGTDWREGVLIVVGVSGRLLDRPAHFVATPFAHTEDRQMSYVCLKTLVRSEPVDNFRNNIGRRLGDETALAADEVHVVCVVG